MNPRDKREDGKLVPQKNYRMAVWMPGSFKDQKERSNKELTSKGRIESERQWGSKVKGASVLQNISKEMASLWKECVNIFYSQVGKDKLSSYELNKGTSVYRQAQGRVLWGKLLSMITTRATKSKSKKQFPTLNQNWLPPCNTSTIMKTTLPGYFNFFQGKLEISTVIWSLPSLL